MGALDDEAVPADQADEAVRVNFRALAAARRSAMIMYTPG
jgi:hypothetical protein